MRRYLIKGELLEEDAVDFATRLAKAYRGKIRPFCLCRDPGVPMYIADIGDQHVVKRMPLSGGDHDPVCPSYEPPYGLSGLGALIGTAINLDPSAGVAALKLDFSLSKRSSTTSAGAETAATGSIKNDARKLSLRALLHLLWHESGLTEWTSNWTGKRHWRQVYRHLTEAAGNMTVRGESLTDRLFIPEPFRTDDRAAIAQRRSQKLAGLFQPAVGTRRLMVMVAEIKEFADARSGQQMIIRHMPGVRFHLEDAAWRSLQRRFETELALWKSDDALHLMTIVTVGGNPAGLITVNEIALMTVTAQWLPIEDAFERRLVERLVRLRMKSVKGLRFNLSRNQPMANVILPERQPLACALYIVPAGADEGFEISLKEMIEARPDLEAWIWRVADGDLPPLPI
jgi:hypothetical protein